MKYTILFILLTVLYTTNSQASSLVSFSDNITNKWENAKNGQEDFYLPLHTWHNRYTYDHDKIKTFNENPYGFGYGRSYIDQNNNWHGFYAMAFLDSHNNIEPIFGYGYTKNWNKNNFILGAGYTLLVTAREDVYHYLPIPGALPLLTLGYKNFTLSGTYLPGGKNNGNIAFFWGRYNFK